MPWADPPREDGNVPPPFPGRLSGPVAHPALGQLLPLQRGACYPQRGRPQHVRAHQSQGPGGAGTQAPQQVHTLISAGCVCDWQKTPIPLPPSRETAEWGAACRNLITGPGCARSRVLSGLLLAGLCPSHWAGLAPRPPTMPCPAPLGAVVCKPPPPALHLPWTPATP